MKIVSFGCSFMYGTDLSDCHGKNSPSQLTWPALIAKKMGLQYQCYANGGSGNLSIADYVLNYIPYHLDDLFIIKWTFIDRFDYNDPQGHYVKNGVKTYKTLAPNNKNKIDQFYYRHIHSEYRDKLTNLMYIKLVLDSLQENRCKFLMTYVDPLLFCNKWNFLPPVIKLQQQLRPYMLDFDNTGFVDWSQKNNFPISNTLHPLETAHQAAAEYCLPAVEQLL
jgi:hypothetical protein